MEEGEEALSPLTPDHTFADEDTIWVVGEKEDLERLQKANRIKPKSVIRTFKV